MDNTALLSNFMASYVKHFGQKFKVASFGYSRLTDLIKAIPEVAEVCPEINSRTVNVLPFAVNVLPKAESAAVHVFCKVMCVSSLLT